MYFLITISLYYRMLILKQHPRDFWDIFTIWVIGMFFVFIASANKGLYDIGSKRFWLALGTGVTISTLTFLTLLFIAGEIHSVADAGLYLIGLLFGIGPVIAIAYFLNRARSGVNDHPLSGWLEFFPTLSGE